MNKRLYYIASFDIEANRAENRLNVLSSTNKINYLISVLNELGYGVDVISTSPTLNKKCYSGKCYKWGVNTIKLFPTIRRGGMFLKLLNITVMNVALIWYILTKVKPRETVIIYHSYGTMWLNILLKIKRVNLIIECEEIYGDIFGKKWLSYLEHKLLKSGNAYIYPTKLLNKIVNKKNQPYLVVHGAYADVGAKFFSDCAEETVTFAPSLYHVAYTGILDPRKGCMDVVRAAEFLDDTYHIHILGFGSPSEKELLAHEIDRIGARTKCKITYDGIRKGQEYTNYLKRIDLGVCTLDINQQFTMTQFPSKIISYMSVGVPVLCSEAKAIKECDVSEAITFYSGNTPQDIARGIRLARSKNRIDTISLLKECDEKLKQELIKLI